jgi:hypothetical protein
MKEVDNLNDNSMDDVYDNEESDSPSSPPRPTMKEVDNLNDNSMDDVYDNEETDSITSTKSKPQSTRCSTSSTSPGLLAAATNVKQLKAAKQSRPRCDRSISPYAKDPNFPDFNMKQTKYGNNKLVYQGYSFTQDNVKYTSGKARKNWKCCNKQCSMRAITTDFYKPCAVELSNDRGSAVHHECHEPNIDKLIAEDATSEMYDRIETTQEKPRTIITDVMSKLQNGSGIHLADPRNIATVLRRKKNAKYGPAASTLADITVPLPQTVTLNGDRPFVLKDSGADDPERIIMFSTARNLSCLVEPETVNEGGPNSRQIREWFIDGTFNIAPALFTQMFTFQKVKNGYNLPLVYALLTDKKSNTYRRMFDYLAEAISGDERIRRRYGDLDWTNLIWRCDFEKSIWKG